MDADVLIAALSAGGSPGKQVIRNPSAFQFLGKGEGEGAPRDGHATVQGEGEGFANVEGVFVGTDGVESDLGDREVAVFQDFWPGWVCRPSGPRLQSQWTAAPI